MQTCLHLELKTQPKVVTLTHLSGLAVRLALFGQHQRVTESKDQGQYYKTFYGSNFTNFRYKLGCLLLASHFQPTLMFVPTVEWTPQRCFTQVGSDLTYTH